MTRAGLLSLYHENCLPQQDVQVLNVAATPAVDTGKHFKYVVQVVCHYKQESGQRQAWS